MKRVVLAFGTRPEATKMAPVYLALRGIPGLKPLVLLTGQHREQLRQLLRESQSLQATGIVYS